MKKISFVIIILSLKAYAGASIHIPVFNSMSMSDLVITDNASSSRIPARGLTINLVMTCYGTNLRAVPNPISPSAAIGLTVKLVSKGGANQNITIVFPGYLVYPDPSMLDVYDVNATDPSKVMPLIIDGVPQQGLGTVQGTASRNSVVAHIPASLVDMSFDVKNTVAITKSVRTVWFRQDMISDPHGAFVDYATSTCEYDFYKKNKFEFFSSIFSPLVLPLSHAGGGGAADLFLKDPCNPVDVGYGQPRWAKISPYYQDFKVLKAYTGSDGKLSGSWEFSWTSDFKTLDINAAFPGQYGFCGGYYSPLMLFFDKDRPRFSSTVNFVMHPGRDQTPWPEQESKGYFLVLDKNEDGIINDYTEMFGSEDERSNGFEVLRDYDDNKDGVIDAKDEVFTYLRLWKDQTGKGITRPEDLHTLENFGIEQISLNYTSDSIIPIGKRAELREKSTFKYRRKGQLKMGDVVDVWFGIPR